MSVKVVKANGELEEYSEDKIRQSASRVGVPTSLQDDMLSEIRSKLYDEIPTREIFEIIKSYLKKSPQPHLSIKYDLRDALAELGPSGYPFEKYLSHLLEELGYHCQINEQLAGECVTHEVDILADKDGTTYFIEAKFHSKPHQRTDVKVPLYIRARYDDLSANFPGQTQSWIITNTRFSSDAISYSNCRTIKLTSWGYPKGEGIMDLIETTKLFPITMLDTLTKDDKQTLLSAGIVVCRQLVQKQHAALIPSSRRASVLNQISAICIDHSE